MNGSRWLWAGLQEGANVTSKAELYGREDSRPAMLAPIWENIPAALRALPQWIIWQLQWRKTKWQKVPLLAVSAKRGQYYGAASTKPEHWRPFKLNKLRNICAGGTESVNGAIVRYRADGPGFVFKAGGGLVGIDLDGCRNPVTGELSAFALELVRRLPGYWEVSPSGRGIKGIFFGELPDWLTVSVADVGGGQDLEVYSWGRYFAVTGHRLSDATADVSSCADQLPPFLAEFFPVSSEPRPAPANHAVRVAPHVGGHSATDVIERAAIRLCNSAEPAVFGRNGSRQLIPAIRLVMTGLDLSPAETRRIIATHYLPRCGGHAISEEDLDRAINSVATKPAVIPVGCLVPVERTYENLSPEEIDSLINGMGSKQSDVAETPAVATQSPPEPCPYAALKDGREWIANTARRCASQSPVILKAGNMPFVCDRQCGSGKECRACLMSRVYKSLKESDSYLIQYHLPAEHEGPGEPRVVVAALIPESVKPDSRRWETLADRIRDLEGERSSILTEDVGSVSDELEAGLSGTPGFFLKDNKVEGESRSASRGRLFYASLPAKVVTGDALTLSGFTFRRVGVATAIRAMYEAARHVPEFTSADKNCKVTHPSRGWGIKEEKARSNVEKVAASKFSAKLTATILHRAQIESKRVEFDAKHGSSPGVGWVLPAPHSLAVTLWLSGTDAPRHPTMSRVIDLIRHWLPMIPSGVGDGIHVEAVLRQHIWHLELNDITDELIAAAEQDQMFAWFQSDLRDQFEDREEEAEGVFKTLIA